MEIHLKDNPLVLKILESGDLKSPKIYKQIIKGKTGKRYNPMSIIAKKDSGTNNINSPSTSANNNKKAPHLVISQNLKMDCESPVSKNSIKPSYEDLLTTIDMLKNTVDNLSKQEEEALHCKGCPVETSSHTHPELQSENRLQLLDLDVIDVDGENPKDEWQATLTGSNRRRAPSLQDHKSDFKRKATVSGTNGSTKAPPNLSTPSPPPTSKDRITPRGPSNTHRHALQPSNASQAQEPTGTTIKMVSNAKNPQTPQTPQRRITIPNRPQLSYMLTQQNKL